MFRINITVSEEVNEKLNAMAKKWGVTKSNLCAMVLGQYVDGIDKAYDLVKDFATKRMETIVPDKKALEDLKGQLDIADLLKAKAE